MANTVGERLRSARREHRLTLGELAARTGISVSTLSRLESGHRPPALDHLLALAAEYDTSLDDLVGRERTEDPRVHAEAVVHEGVTYLPLTRRPDGLRAFKVVFPPHFPSGDPDPRTHEGHEWTYVLSGRLRLVLGEHDLCLAAGEVAEFDTRTPHWFANPGSRPLELLTLFGPQGERMHVRARPKRGSESRRGSS